MTLSVFKGFTKLTRFLPHTRSLLLSSASVGFLDSTPNARTIARYVSMLSRDSTQETICTTAVNISWSKICRRGIHTKGDKEYVASLEKEELSKETRTTPILKFEGFDCKYEGTVVTLSKSLINETITIKADLKDSAYSPDPDLKELKLFAYFSIEVAKGGKIFLFDCRCYDEIWGSMDVYLDEKYLYDTTLTKDTVFFIRKMCIYEGELNDSTYAVHGYDERIDHDIRNMAMKYLDKLGISDDFVVKLMAFYSSYELQLCADLLQGMENFIKE